MSHKVIGLVIFEPQTCHKKFPLTKNHERRRAFKNQTMEHYYIALLVFLGLIAVFDIFVGVSNDAVNFLNSALGCRIASFKTTMFVASIGVMLGATFSSGMMEIARSGVFHPQMFNFSEIMVIFFAVMVADIILLDTFNSLGLPPSNRLPRRR